MRMNVYVAAMKYTILNLLAISLSFSQTAFGATKSYSYSGQLMFASKAVAESALPHALSSAIPLQAKFDIFDSDSVVKKVFQNEVSSGALKVKFQIWYHRDQNSEYFSQQIYLYENNQVLAFCSAYFSAAQTYLVPSSCWGRSLTDSNLLMGLSLSMRK